MSFRVRLYVCLLVAVLVGVLAEIAFDTMETRDQVAGATERAIEEVVRQAQAWLEAGGDAQATAILDVPHESDLSELIAASHVQIVRDGLVIGSDAARAEPTSATVRASRELQGGTRVDVEVDPSAYAQVLYERLRSDLLTDVVQVALSFGAVWLLAGWLQRPVRQLTRKVEAMAVERLPEPVSIPDGNDEFAELARAFNRMTVSVTDAFERERAFTRYASHELRTPLSAIQLQVESLRLGMTRGPAAAAVLERNVQRMQRVLDALLGLARVVEQPMDRIPLGRLVDEVVEGLDGDMRERLVLDLRGSAKTPVPSASLLAQAITNLLGNAFKYTDGPVEMQFGESDGDAVRIVVRDHGPGVPDDVLGMLTRAYFRFGAGAEGTGLGLAFVKQAVDAVGGDLRLRNRPGGFEAELSVPIAGGGSTPLVHAGHRVGSQSGHDQRQ